MQAADRFHVAPWALLERGTVWRDLALAALGAERQAAAEIARRNERHAAAARRQRR